MFAASDFLMICILHWGSLFEGPSVQITDLDRFPNYNYCVLVKYHQSLHYQWLSHRAGLCPEDDLYWYYRRQDMLLRMQVWQALCNAHSNRECNRRYCLEQLSLLRYLIGDDYYYYGCMPTLYRLDHFYLYRQ